MTVSEIKKLVKDYIKEHAMICKGQTVGVAVSGGADSMCLLFLLHELKEEMDFDIKAVHVEHGIRGEESVLDMEYVRETCLAWDIPLEIHRIDVPAVSKETGTSVEEAARNERYRIFTDTEADRIALAHHKDDIAETVIYNLIRGSGVNGLKGIDPVRGRYIRPLLCLTREDTEKVCRENDIRYRTDSTNEDTDIPRNRIRHKILPELMEINDRAVDHIVDTSSDIRMISGHIHNETGKAKESCLSYTNGRYELDIEKLDRLDQALRSALIKDTLISAAGRARDIGRRHIDAVLDLMCGQSGRHVDLIYGIKAARQFGKLVIFGPGKYEQDGGSALPDGPPHIEFTVLDIAKTDMEDISKGNNYTKFIDYATIGGTYDLAIRHRQSGDHISIKGGSKKIKDLMIEEKVPPDMRDALYLVTLGSEVVWMIDTGRIGERFKVTEGTKQVLKMEIKNG